MTYFVKVTRLNSTDYTIKTLHMPKSHHSNKLYVLISFCVIKCKQNTKKTIHIVDSSIEMHGNYARNKAVSCSENSVRANGW